MKAFFGNALGAKLEGLCTSFLKVLEWGAMDRRSLQMELLCHRGCFAPEDLCRLSMASREWQGCADSEAAVDAAGSDRGHVDS